MGTITIIIRTIATTGAMSLLLRATRVLASGHSIQIDATLSAIHDTLAMNGPHAILSVEAGHCETATTGVMEQIPNPGAGRISPGGTTTMFPNSASKEITNVLMATMPTAIRAERDLLPIDPTVAIVRTTKTFAQRTRNDM